MKAFSAIATVLLPFLLAACNDATPSTDLRLALPETLRPVIGSTGRASLYGTGLTGTARLRQLSDAANRHTRTFEARYVLVGDLSAAPIGSTISIQISDGRATSS